MVMFAYQRHKLPEATRLLESICNFPASGQVTTLTKKPCAESSLKLEVQRPNTRKPAGQSGDDFFYPTQRHVVTSPPETLQRQSHRSGEAAKVMSWEPQESLGLMFLST